MAMGPTNSSNKRITYKQKMSGSDLFRYVKAVALPVGVFVIALITIQNLAGFGSKIVAPLTGAMWAVGVITCLILPSHRASVLKTTHVTIGIYLITLFALKHIITLMSGVSSEVFMETFNQAIPVTSGSAVSGWLQNMMWITGVMTPIGFIGMQGKRIFTFRKNAAKETFMERIRGVRTSNKLNDRQ